MATLHDIRRRIGSVQNTHKITRAMEMVAAAKLRRAQDRIEYLRPYAVSMIDMMQDLAPLPHAEHPGSPQRTSRSATSPLSYSPATAAWRERSTPT